MRRVAGFTLIEVLVTMVVLGLLLGSLTSFWISTLRVSSSAETTAQQMLNLQDASAYIADRVRGASAILSQLTVTDPDGTSRGCALEPDPALGQVPCLGMLVRKINAAGDIQEHLYLALIFMFDSRALLSADYKLPDTWLDTNSFILRQYRLECTTAPMLFPSTPICPGDGGSITGVSGQLLVDGLTTTGLSGPFVPFTLTGAEIVLRLRGVARINGRVLYFPAADSQATPGGVYRLTVRARNL
jgi:prepilin-type N-terminal cleavage/methylation domain-containing protein